MRYHKNTHIISIHCRNVIQMSLGCDQDYSNLKVWVERGRSSTSRRKHRTLFPTLPSFPSFGPDYSCVIIYD